jgi:hypothetical protein
MNDVNNIAWEPLGRLSLLRDYWLTVGDPEDIVYMLIEENHEMKEFYERNMHHPIKDQLRVAKKIRQLNYCIEGNNSKKALLRLMVNFAERDYPGWSPDPVADDPCVALAELEGVLTELRGRYPINHKGHDSQTADQDEDEEATAIDWWLDVFEGVENLRKVLPSLEAVTKSASRPQGFVGRIGYRVGKAVAYLWYCCSG